MHLDEFVDEFVTTKVKAVLRTAVSKITLILMSTTKESMVAITMSGLTVITDGKTAITDLVVEGENYNE